MNDPKELINAHLDGELEKAEHEKLNAWLAADPANVKEFTGALMFDQEMRAAAHAQAERQAAETFSSGPTPVLRMSRHWLEWRPLVAGLVIGLSSATVVWAVTTQGGFPSWQGMRLWLANAGFEEPQDLPQVHLVPEAGQWSGITTEIVEAGSTRPLALEGSRMMKLGPAPVGKGYFANLIVDLDGQRPPHDGPLALQISAAYHASVPDQDEHYSLYGATFAEGADGVASHWTDMRQELQDHALTSVHRAAFPTAEQPGWHRVVVTLEVPQRARSLMISLGSNTPGPPGGRTDHYMDDVRAVWIQPTPPATLNTP